MPQPTRRQENAGPSDPPSPPSFSASTKGYVRKLRTRGSRKMQHVACCKVPVGNKIYHRTRKEARRPPSAQQAYLEVWILYIQSAYSRVLPKYGSTQRSLRTFPER